MNARMRHTMHVNDYTVEEEKACWYKCEDYIKMINEIGTMSVVHAPLKS
jgi:hypothetical protein